MLCMRSRGLQQERLQRREEALSMAWDEQQTGQWVLPGGTHLNRAMCGFDAQCKAAVVTGRDSVRVCSFSSRDHAESRSTDTAPDMVGHLASERSAAASVVVTFWRLRWCGCRHLHACGLQRHDGG